MSDPEVVGKPTPAVRSRDIVTGSARYAADYHLPGQLTGKLLYAAHPHARIRRIDASAARCLPGVAAVLLAEDVPGENSYLHITSDQPLLAADRVRYLGDAVAAVAAEDEETALAALAAIRVDYEPLPGLYDVMEALQPDAPQVWEGRSNIMEHCAIRRGDVELGFRQADVIIERTYRAPWAEQAFLEPEGGTAFVDSDGTMVVYSSGQAPHHDRPQIARALGLPENRVRVIQPHVGGAFGGKDEAHVQIHAALLAWVTGRPVNVTRTRQESLFTHAKRHPAIITMRSGATRDGRLVAVQGRAVCDAGPYRNCSPEVVVLLISTLGGPYQVPNVLFDGYAVYTNNPISGAFRGFGGPQACLAHERQMDELARALSIDRLELRLINGLETGDRLPIGIQVRQGAGMKASLQAAARLIGWPEPHAAQSPATENRQRGPDDRNGRRRGWGLAACAQPLGIGRNLPDAAGATLDMAQDGSVVLHTGAADMGQGVHTILAQIAAEALGVDLAAVRVALPDTDQCVDAGRSVASRQAIVSGNAVLKAATVIRQSLLETAAELGYPSDRLALRRGRLVVDGEEVNVTTGALAAQAWAHNRPLHAIGYYAMEYPELPPEPEPPWIAQMWAFGAQAAQVSVDPETGDVRVEKLAAVHDVGRILNPQAAAGQVIGGAIQGLGYGTLEELLADQGRVLNPDLHSYLIPTAHDVPEVKIELLESGEPFGPYGATGLGEPPIVPTAAAIANAVSDALGVPVDQIPLTPERVLAAIRTGEERRAP